MTNKSEQQNNVQENIFQLPTKYYNKHFPRIFSEKLVSRNFLEKWTKHTEFLHRIVIYIRYKYIVEYTYW